MSRRPFQLFFARSGSGALLGVAHTLEMVLPLVRSVAMAHLLPPREFALALTLSTVVGIAEMTTDIGVQQLAVKSDIADQVTRGTYQVLSAVRAVLVGGVVALLAFPLSMLFDSPGAVLAFALCGASLAIRGFSNLAIKQTGRSFDFGPEAVTIIVSQGIWTASLVLFCFLWHDHWAMTLSLLVYAVGAVGASHWTAPVRFRFGWKPELAAEALRFGRPLIPNGVAIALTQLGDRMIVGAKLGLEPLAIYGPLTTTAMLPRSTALRYLMNLFLPVIVLSIEKGESGRAGMRRWIAALSLLGVSFGLGFMTFAAPVIGFVFGARYQPAPLLTSLMGLLLLCRILQGYPVPIAIATGRTWFVASSSAIAAISLAPAAAALFFLTGQPLMLQLAWFLGVLAVVETIGIGLVVARTRRTFPAAAGIGRSTLLSMSTVYGVALVCWSFGAESWTARLPFAAAGLVTAMLVFLPGLRARSPMVAAPL